MQATLEDLLARSELFAGLAAHELEAIARACEQRDFERDETIFAMLEPADGLYVIATGRVKVCVSSSGGKELILATLGPGQFFGEMALLDDAPRSATVIAVAPGHYVTLFVGEYDSFTNRLRYANCGHVPPMLLRGDGGVSWLESTATVLGLFEDWACSVGESDLVLGDLLLAYTDGVTEAQDAAGNEFGADRIVDVARAAHQRPLPELLEDIAAAVRRFAGPVPLDDVTVLAVRRRDAVRPQPLRPQALGNVLPPRDRRRPCSST